MMKSADLVAELFGDIDHLRHFVRAIAMIVDQNISTQHFGERFEAEIARRRIAFACRIPIVPLATIAFSLNPGGAITSHVTHPRRWSTLLIDTLRVLAAGHLQAVLGAGKFHSL